MVITGGTYSGNQAFAGSGGSGVSIGGAGGDAVGGGLDIWATTR